MGVERFLDGQHGNVKLNARIEDACGNPSTISASQERCHVVLNNMLVRHHDGFRYGKPRPRRVIRAGTCFDHPNGIAELRTNRRRSQLDQAVRIGRRWLRFLDAVKRFFQFLDTVNRCVKLVGRSTAAAATARESHCRNQTNSCGFHGRRITKAAPTPPDEQLEVHRVDRSTHPKMARVPAEAGILRGRAGRI